MISIGLIIDVFSNNLKRPPLEKLKTVEELKVFNATGSNDSNPIGGPGYNFNTVEWLETFGR